MPEKDPLDEILGEGREQIDAFRPYMKLLDNTSLLLSALAQHREPSREQSQYVLFMPPLEYGDVPKSLRDHIHGDQISALSVTFVVEQPSDPDSELPLTTTSLELTAGNRTVHIGRDDDSPEDEEKEGIAFDERGTPIGYDYIVIDGAREPKNIPRVPSEDITYLLLLSAGYEPSDLRDKDLRQVNILAPESISYLVDVISKRGMKRFHAKSYDIDGIASIHTMSDSTATDTGTVTETVIRFPNLSVPQLHVTASAGLKVELKEMQDYELVPIVDSDEGDLITISDRVEDLISRATGTHSDLEIVTAPNRLDTPEKQPDSTPSID